MSTFKFECVVYVSYKGKLGEVKKCLSCHQSHFGVAAQSPPPCPEKIVCLQLIIVTDELHLKIKVMCVFVSDTCLCLNLLLLLQLANANFIFMRIARESNNELYLKQARDMLLGVA